MNKRSKKIFVFIMVFFASFVFMPLTFSKYVKNLDKSISLTITQPKYKVRFHSNYNDGQTEQTIDQDFVYGVSQRLRANTFVHSTLHFAGWTTKANGTGTKYANRQSVNNLTSTNNGIFHLYARWSDWIAEVNGTYYTSLQEAITACPNNVETTVTLLADTSETITIGKAKNVILDLQTYTVSNVGNTPVIENAGTLSISNGTITSDAEKNGALNNTGTLNMSGGSIIATGGRQAIYNNGGTATISGNAYLSATTTERAAVHNLNNGNLTILGGTIISKGFYAVYSQSNAGIMVIGSKDGNVSNTTPLIEGLTYGVYSTQAFEFHDGIVKGVNNAFYNINHITILEDDYQVVNSTEVIDGLTYKTAHLGIPVTVTYNANGGNVSPTTINLEKGKTIGILPEPTRAGYAFDGWFTAGGEKIESDYVLEGDIELIAHWTKIKVARIGNTEYDYLRDAITAAGTNQTTIELLANISENITISNGKNITFDLQNYTLKNDGNNAVITVNGNISIINGTVTSNADTAAINVNDGGRLMVENGARIVATGTRQAIYIIDGGYTEIKEGSYLSSVTTGKPTLSALERATVQNLPGGTVVISGGEIVNTVQQAISNEGNMTIGVDDGNINVISPLVKGETHAVHNLGNLYFYDGILKGITGAIDGTVIIDEDNTRIVSNSETIDNKTYNVEYLELLS